jgi:hypothetical protein
VRGVSSSTHTSREAEHYSKTTRVQGEIPRAQHLKMWIQLGGLCMRIVGEPLRTLLQSLMFHTERCTARRGPILHPKPWHLPYN